MSAEAPYPQNLEDICHVENCTGEGTRLLLDSAFRGSRKPRPDYLDRTMVPRVLFATLSLFAAYVLAENVATTKIRIAGCLLGCTDVLTTLTFGDYNTSLDYYAMYGSSTLFMSSVAACGKAYCHEPALQAGWAEFAGYAVEYGGVDVGSIEDWEARINGDPPLVDALVASQEATVFNETILINEQCWKYGSQTESTWDLQMIYNHAFGWSMYLFVLTCGLVGVINRFFATWARRQPPTAGPPGLYSRFTTLYRKYLSVPAFYGYKHNQSGWGFVQIPTRMSGILIGLYVLLNILLTVVPYHLFEENFYWPRDMATQHIRYVADRTGIMAFYNLPLLFVLGGRNDVFLWVCGWSFPEANRLHRWVARVATAQAIGTDTALGQPLNETKLRYSAVTSRSAYTWLERDYLAVSFGEMYWQAGMVATICMAFTLGLSLKPVRDRAYEVFLIGHIILSAATLGALMYHVTIYEGQYNGWIWACVAVWLFDRVVRVIRITVLRRYSKESPANAEAVLSQDSVGMIRLTVLTTSVWTYSAGCYFFIYFPKRWNFWENHPFTLASVEADEKGSKLHFLIAPQSGSTGRLARQIRRAGGTLPMTVWMEGPYGHSAPVQQFEKALMVAGGSGITPFLSYLQRLQRLADTKVLLTRHIHIVWAVRSRAYAHSLLDLELDRLTRGLSVTLDIHVTTEEAEGINEVPMLPAHGSDGAADEADTKEALRASKGSAAYTEPTTSGFSYSWKDGRPAMQDAMEEAFANRQADERLAVMSCGPAQMMDDIRRAVVTKYGFGKGQVLGQDLEYFEEGFGW